MMESVYSLTRIGGASLPDTLRFLQVIAVQFPNMSLSDSAQGKWLRANCSLPPVKLAGYAPCPHCWLKPKLIGTVNLVPNSPDNPFNWCQAHASYQGAHNETKRDRTHVAKTEKYESALREASDAPVYAITPFQLGMIEHINAFINLRIGEGELLSKKIVRREAKRFES